MSMLRLDFWSSYPKGRSVNLQKGVNHHGAVELPSMENEPAIIMRMKPGQAVRMTSIARGAGADPRRGLSVGHSR
jgi:hypothetical protein